jgi:molybdopterin molybdotransferase
MISVEQALEMILARIDILEAEERPVLDCLGQVLAEDVFSTINIPPLDNSAMDGYAIRAEDSRGASPPSPRILRVIDAVMAGSISGCEVAPGTAIRIMTGAPVPTGADAVVRFEDTDEAGRLPPGETQRPVEIGIRREVAAGADIRRAGEDVSQGSQVLSRGTVIRPSEIGVLASLGRAMVKVIRRPVVAVLATGDELVNAGEPLPPGKIYNSNTYSLAALVLRYGGVPRVLGIASDREDALVSQLSHGRDADLLITSGGVSLGDYDVVKDVLAREGEINFWTVRIKPGKPLAFGTIRGMDKTGAARNIPLLGLPGNPVSVMVTFELFARPAILKMMGRRYLSKPVIEAVLEDSIENTDGRRVFARAVVEERNGQYFARTTGPQGSGILTSMSLGNGLAIVPEDEAGAGPGDRVQVMMLDWSQELWN